MDASRYKTETLKKKLEEYKDKLYQSKLQDHEKVNNIGHGYGMRAYSKLKHLSFSKSDKIEENIRAIKIELYRRAQVGKGYILSFKDFKYLAEWKEQKHEWHIYWQGKKVCTQPKHDINIVEIRKYYNKTFFQYEINFDNL